jgi:hypothetical protein
MRRFLILALFCSLTACKSNSPPPPPSGVAVDVPGVHIRVPTNYEAYKPLPEPTPTK